MESVKVTVIGTGGESEGLVGGTTARTPTLQPNIYVNVISPFVAIVVRFLNVYVGMVVGLLGTAMTSQAITAPDFGSLLIKCMGLAVGGAVVLSLKDIVTIFARLENKFPLSTGQV